jgi:hypothetical protein
MNSRLYWLERLTANAEVATVLGSIQHPPTQWNLRGGRLSSVEYSIWKTNPKNPVVPTSEPSNCGVMAKGKI